MDYNKFPKNLQMLNDDGASDHLYGGEIPIFHYTIKMVIY